MEVAKNIGGMLGEYVDDKSNGHGICVGSLRDYAETFDAVYENHYKKSCFSVCKRQFAHERRPTDNTFIMIVLNGYQTGTDQPGKSTREVSFQVGPDDLSRVLFIKSPARNDSPGSGRLQGPTGL
ncbi:hypothetical protein ACLB2K_007699 [Fragaria x ananassa]